MNTLKKILVVGALALAALVSVPAVRAAATDGISLPGVSGLDNPPFISYSWKPTQNFVGSLTNGQQALLTNIIINVYPDQPVTFVFRGALTTGGATNAPVFYFDLSHDGGRTWTIPTPATLVWSNAIVGSNVAYQVPYTMSYTQLLGAQLVRATKWSNSTPAGTAISTIYASNFVFSTRKPAFWGR